MSIRNGQTRTGLGGLRDAYMIRCWLWRNRQFGMDTSFNIWYGNENILRFNVSVNEIAFIMKILKAEKYLLRDDLNEGFWNTLLLVALN
jgi:hypothetical protein